MTTAFVEAGSLFCQRGRVGGGRINRMCWLSGRFDDDTPLTVKAADIAIDSDCRATCTF